MRSTDTILDKIVADKRTELEALKKRQPLSDLERQAAAMPQAQTPSFYEALKATTPHAKIIAEVKKASPSSGVLRQDFSLGEINEAYQAAANVVAISVLTESQHFQGSADNLAFFAGRNTQHKPLLRKDFIFDPYQIVEAKVLGAQAYLLIAALFEAEELDELVRYGQSLGLEPLVEVHDAAELARVRQTSARCIGVNSRDLRDFSIDTTAHELLGELDDTYARIAESGIETPKQLAQVMTFADAALVGTQLMAADNIGAAITELVGEGTSK